MNEAEMPPPGGAGSLANPIGHFALNFTIYETSFLWEASLNGLDFVYECNLFA